MSMSEINPMLPQCNPITTSANRLMAQSNLQLSPVGGNFVVDRATNPEEQAEAVLKYYDMYVPDKVYQYTDRQETEEDIKVKSRLVERELKNTTDFYNSASTKIAAEVIQDGRSHITSIFNVINDVNLDYQKSFGEITKAATQFMEKVNKGLGAISQCLDSGSNGYIKFNKQKFFNLLKDSLQDYTYAHTKNFWEHSLSIDNINNVIKPMARFDSKPGMLAFWQKKLNGQGFLVKEIDHTIYIYPDMQPIKDIYETVNPIMGASTPEGEMMVQTFQSMQTAIDSKKNAVNNSVSRLLETFRQDNSHFETLTQLLIQLLKDLFQYNVAFANT
ncbi:hypothetical protein ABN056_12355 [Providencia vermicola]|uniref:hypothetical protein n=1 Tax=Providencia TaxID=586 RepID=UPI0022B5E9CE|nr:MULTISPECIES: hypothetical protein [Providencia]ELR5122541.1 hypothetical protein [Providencia stuartii]ELR5143806.1 hypothetical protein [Providencia stuartii]WBA56953.1 hypothetical protein O7C57_19400 [Providencia sp. 21OH12SH02B-Prov]WER22422.1 hypothetical protein P2E04_00730 [Providencia stuartii]WER26542.1 hypothetical protein P2E05_00730 [Providencia stuartii]